MSSIDHLLQQALALPPEDRAFVVNALEQSLAPAQPGDEDLLQELQRRSAAYRNGATTARPANDVISDLEKRQAQGRTP